MSIHLKGITWNHSRGYVPMVATAQRFMEMNEDVEITWKKRSLQEFADYPLEHLINDYDLLVIDHPWAGFAAHKQDVLVPLEKHLPHDFLADQAANAVGKSHESYNFDGYQTALATDAATPIATYRPDLFQAAERPLPRTWEDLIGLAKDSKVIFAAIPIDLLMHFYMLCVTQGEEPCTGSEHVVSDEMGVRVLEQLQELTSVCAREIFQCNPIKVYAAMSTRNDLYYCPFSYGYSNYSRLGYAPYLLQATDMICMGSYGRLVSTLGGAGLAISAKTKHLQPALQYAMYTAAAATQKGIFFASGGQPGHRSAWLDEQVNKASADFFKNTLPALDRAYMRPRYSGYFHFQDHAGDVIHDYLRLGGDVHDVLEQLNALFRESKQGVGK